MMKFQGKYIPIIYSRGDPKDLCVQSGFFLAGLTLHGAVFKTWALAVAQRLLHCNTVKLKQLDIMFIIRISFIRKG